MQHCQEQQSGSTSFKLLDMRCKSHPFLFLYFFHHHSPQLRLVLVDWFLTIDSSYPLSCRFDIPILQVLHTTEVNRIVLQRAPCARKDFCEGVGTWNGFFRGMYFSMLESAKKTHVPVYVRFHENESTWQPKLHPDGTIAMTIAAQSNSSGKSSSLLPTIPVREVICFDRVIRRSIHRPPPPPNPNPLPYLNPVLWVIRILAPLST